MQKKHLMLTLLMSLGLTLSAYAYKVVPVVVSLSPQGDGAKKMVEIQNDGDEPIALQVDIQKRTMLDDGKDKLSEISDDLFALYPMQVVIPKHKSQAVTLQYTGPADIKEEEAYRLMFEQVPIDFEKPTTDQVKGSISFLINYNTPLYVRPADTHANMDVLSVSQSVMDGKPIMLVKIKNTGKAHAVIYSPELMVEADNGVSATLKGEDANALAGANILPGVTRTFTLPWPKDLKGDNFVGELKFSPGE